MGIKFSYVFIKKKSGFGSVIFSLKDGKLYQLKWYKKKKARSIRKRDFGFINLDRLITTN